MAEVSVKAVSPRITLDMDMIEAQTLKVLLDNELAGSGGLGRRNDALGSVRSSLTNGLQTAEGILRGVDYVQET